MPSSVLGFKTPYELLYGHSSSYSHLKSFGSLYFISTPKHNRDTFAPRGVLVFSLDIFMARRLTRSTTFLLRKLYVIEMSIFMRITFLFTTSHPPPPILYLPLFFFTLTTLDFLFHLPLLPLFLPLLLLLTFPFLYLPLLLPFHLLILPLTLLPLSLLLLLLLFLLLLLNMLQLFLLLLIIFPLWEELQDLSRSLHISKITSALLLFLTPLLFLLSLPFVALFIYIIYLPLHLLTLSLSFLFMNHNLTSKLLLIHFGVQAIESKI